MSTEQVIAKAKKSYWITTGWGVAFGIAFSEADLNGLTIPV
jgi:hypothetical protein